MSETSFQQRYEPASDMTAIVKRDETASTNDNSFDSTRDVEPGFLVNLIRNQPALILSLAFGLGLLATTVLARRKI